MGASFGKNIKVTVFGESHGNCIGVVIDALPLGEEIDEKKVSDFLKRRAPGGKFTTPRSEKDNVKFISGVKNNRIVSNTVCAIIENTDMKSSDYENFKDIPRPSHADYVAYKKYDGKMDMNGSGAFSGRMTAPICIVGAIAKQILSKRGIEIYARLKSVGAINDDEISLAKPDINLLKSISDREIPVVSDSVEVQVKELITELRMQKDSIGANIECFCFNVPLGLGEPNFDGFESEIASVVFSIPGVRGVYFGDGLNATKMHGNEHNDEFVIENGKVLTKTNHCGGVVGGITNSMPVVFTTMVKPTASIGKSQKSFSITEMKERELVIEGRHDSCIAIRMVPVIEAVAAIVILDFLENKR